MGFGVETIGCHDFTPAGNGMVAVTLNNGNIGACLVDAKTAEALKEKYRAAEDGFSKQNTSDKGPLLNHPPKKEKSFGKAVASYFMTGLGQMCDGRFKDGFKQMGKEAAIEIFGGAATWGLTIAAMAKNSPLGMLAAAGVGLVSTVALIKNKCHSIADAYRGGSKAEA